MPALHLAQFVAVLAEHMAQELADQLVQAEPAVGAPLHQRLADQGREQAQGRVGHRRRRLVGEAADEHAERRERALLLAVEQGP